MKKVILIFLAAIAFSCGDGRNQSSETGTDQTEDNYSDDALEADTTATDTTSSPGMDRESEVDTVSTAP
jgi:hypothetical protein